MKEGGPLDTCVRTYGRTSFQRAKSEKATQQELGKWENNKEELPVYHHISFIYKMRYTKNVLLTLGVSSVLFEALAFSPQRPRTTIDTTVSSSSLAMGYLDNLSPQEPNSGENDNYKPAPPVNASPPSNTGGGVVPSGRGPLGSYLDAVCSGKSGNDHDQQDDDESIDASSGEIEMEERVTSWTRKYLSNFLTDDDPRVDIRNLLTQRSIQSFMRLLEECRDPHSAKCK